MKRWGTQIWILGGPGGGREPRRAYLRVRPSKKKKRERKRTKWGQEREKRAKFWAGPSEGGPEEGGSGTGWSGTGRSGKVQTNNNHNNHTTKPHQHTDTTNTNDTNNTTQKRIGQKMDWPKVAGKWAGQKRIGPKMDWPKSGRQMGWPKKDWPKNGLAQSGRQMGWPQKDWPKLDWPKLAITVVLRHQARLRERLCPELFGAHGRSIGRSRRWSSETFLRQLARAESRQQPPTFRTCAKFGGSGGGVRFWLFFCQRSCFRAVGNSRFDLNPLPPPKNASLRGRGAGADKNEGGWGRED